MFTKVTLVYVNWTMIELKIGQLKVKQSSAKLVLTVAHTVGKKVNIIVRRGCLNDVCVRNNTKQKTLSTIVTIDILKGGQYASHRC